MSHTNHTEYDNDDLNAIRASGILREDAVEYGGSSLYFARQLDYVKTTAYQRLYPELKSSTLVPDNVQRFSLGGAAHRTRREGSAAGDRAGKRKTCWTKPLAQAPGLWAFNEPGSLVRAHDWGFRFGGLAPFGTSTGLSSCQRRRRVTPALRTGAPTTQAAQASRPRSGGRFCFARFGRPVGAHDVSGSDWQILARAMQPITTMMPVWQCGHSRNECPVSAS